MNTPAVTLSVGQNVTIRTNTGIEYIGTVLRIDDFTTDIHTQFDTELTVLNSRYTLISVHNCNCGAEYKEECTTGQFYIL